MSTTIERSTESSIRRELSALTASILQGSSLEQALDHVYANFSNLLPYDRIGFAEVDTKADTVTARWAKSSHPIGLKLGYRAPLKGSSLSVVLERRQPRVLSDLKIYLECRPASNSTRLITEEGIRSSMTCPLFLRDKPFGFLFFSSRQVGAYQEDHVTLMKEIGDQLSLLLMISSELPEPPELTRAPDPTTPSAHTMWTRPKTRVNRKQQPGLMKFSGLKPGMVLDASINLDDGRLLLSSGVTLTAKSINRLLSLHDAGFVSSTALRIR